MQNNFHILKSQWLDRIRILTIILCCASQGYSQYQNMEWAAVNVGNGDDRPLGLAVDHLGNTYQTGYFTSSVDFDPGPGTFYETANDDDIFVQKLDEFGNLVWLKTFSGPDDHKGVGLEVDQNLNVYITGVFDNTVDFDPGAGIFNLTPVLDHAMFVTKLDVNGDFIWAKMIEGPGNVEVQNMSMDGAFNLYFCGKFENAVDFDPGPSTFYLLEEGVIDAFMLKLDSAGNFIWAKQVNGYNGDGIVYSKDIHADQYEQVYLTGTYYDGIDFDPGPDTVNLPLQNALFILKLDVNGDFIWAKEYAGQQTAWENSNAVAVGNDGSVYTTGKFNGIADFEPGSGITNMSSTHGNDRDCFLLKLDSMGVFQWVTHIHNTGDYDEGFDLAMEQGGNIIWTGQLTNKVFVYNVSPAGAFNCKSYFPGIGVSTKIAAENTGDVVVNGHFWYSMDFDPSSAVNQFSSSSGFDHDVYAVRLGGCFTTASNITVDTCGLYQTPSGNQSFGPSSFYGTVVDTLTNSAGYDSLIYIDLAISHTQSTQSIGFCGSFTVPSGDETYYSAGTFSDTIPSVAGCDSILTFNLSLMNSSSSIDIFSCSPYTSPSGNQVLTSSGTFFDIIPNYLGCDSVIMINFELFDSDSVTSISSGFCGSYTVPSGDETYYSPGTYMDTIPSVLGCDSLLEIHIDFLNSYSNLNILSCNPYTSPSGSSIYSTSGVYTDTILNSSGCDSIITINYTQPIIDVNVANLTTYLSAAASGSLSYQWIDCNLNMQVISNETNQDFYPSQNGDYAVIVGDLGCSDTSACISIDQLDISNLVQSNYRVEVYPNPVMDIANIHITGQDGSFGLRLTDISGKLVLEDRLSSNEFHQLSFKHLNSGSYMLKIVDKVGNTKQFKLIVL